MTESLAQRATALTTLCGLAVQLGGSIRVEDGTGTVFYRTSDTAERPIGDSITEAASALSLERERLLSHNS